MAGRLTASFVRKIVEPGKYGDGQLGLRLVVSPKGRKKFVQRITVRGWRRELGLGGYPKVGLAQARAKAREYATIAAQGGDPRRTVPGMPTFAEAAERAIELRLPMWKDGGKSADQWRSSLRTYVFPKIGAMPVGDVTVADVMDILTPIWSKRRVTARRVRSRVSLVMKWSIGQGYRQDDPASDALEAALPKSPRQVTHHRSIPHSQVAEALSKVRASSARPSTRLALEFLVLTAVRSGEVRRAEWQEVDSSSATWTVPAGHTKRHRENCVPLSTSAIDVLRAAGMLREPEPSALVFPSSKGQPMSDTAMSKLLHRLGVPASPHGFRTSFRDWCIEIGQDRNVVEISLEHSLGPLDDPYRNTDIFDGRRVLLQRWADYLSGELAG